VSKTVIQYVLGRLKEHGISDIFGVPGDYVYPVLDSILDDPDLEWRGNCNELNGAYAADGYARTKGLGAFCNTYGSELGAYLALAGAHGEFSPVIMMTGFPSTTQQASGESWHHMLGEHEYSLFNDMGRPLTAGGDATAILTPENCVAEFERVLAAVLYHQQPGILAFPNDLVHKPLVNTGVPENVPLKDPKSDPVALQQAVDHIVDMMSSADKTCAIPGIKVRRAGHADLARTLITSKNLPYTTAFQDKCTLDERTPGFMGIWLGRFTNLEVEEYVASCDCILGLGPERHYFNAGFFTTQVDPKKSINVKLHSVRAGTAEYQNVEMKDVLEALIERLPVCENVDAPSLITPYTEITGGGDDPIDAGEPLYARIAKFLRAGDILIGDPGSPGLACNFLALPEGVGYESQALAASIGWGTPTAVGVAVGAPDRRVVQVGGEGSHQLTAQELGQFYKFGLKPVFIIVNNDGYLVERYTCRDPEAAYNDLPQWQYSKLPEVLGCKDWYCVKVTTTAELDAALEKANNCDTGVYIEVVTDRYSMPPGAEAMFELTRPKFGQQIKWQEWHSEFLDGNNTLAPKL
jgi:indolepyruvate decarboxylase